MTNTLSATDLKELLQALDQREAHLKRDILLEHAGSSSYAEVAGDVTDSGDEARADLLTDIGHAAVNRDVEELRDIDAARRRASAGTYGICTECGAGIVLARLRAYPTAKRCEPCQRAYERLSPTSRSHRSL